MKLGLPHMIRAEKIEKPNDFIYPHGTTIAFDFAERGPEMPEMTINWYDGVRNRPPTEEGVKLASCGKAIYSDDPSSSVARIVRSCRLSVETRSKK